MKTNKSHLLMAALCPFAFALSSWAKTGGAEPVPPSATAAKDPAAAAKIAAPDSWDMIKDYTYEQREAFAAALERMAGKLDAEVREVAAKVAGQTETDAIKQRKVALKEFNEAHIYLKSQLTNLRTGTADTWASAKGRVVQSWEDVQAAYGKVKAGATS